MNAQEMVDSEARYNAAARWLAAGLLVGSFMDHPCIAVAMAVYIVGAVLVMGRLRWHWWFAGKIAGHVRDAQSGKTRMSSDE